MMMMMMNLIFFLLSFLPLVLSLLLFSLILVTLYGNLKAFAYVILSEIPVFPTVTAKVTFQHFSWENEMPASKFVIPKHYTEDPYHFPDLWYFLQLTFISILTSLCCMEEDSKSDPLLSRMSIVSLDIPMTNLGSSGAQMTLLL